MPQIEVVSPVVLVGVRALHALRVAAVPAERARRAAQVVRVGQADGRAARRGEAPGHEVPRRAAEAPHVDLGVVLVRQHEDRHERVRTQEVGTLLEDRRIDPVPLRDGRAAHHRRLEIGVRIRLDEEAVPALELRLDAAAELVNADDELLKVGLQHHRVPDRRRTHGRRGRGLDALVVRVGAREPVEEVRRIGGPERGLRVVGQVVRVGRTVEQVPLIVVVPVDRPAARQRPRGARSGAWTRVRGEAPSERRAHDPDVQVVNGRELRVRGPRAAVARDVGLSHHVAHAVDAVRRHEPGDKVRDGLREVRLLVTHRRRVVDVEQQVHLVDGRLLDRGDEVRLRDGVARLDRTREAPVDQRERTAYRDADGDAGHDLSKHSNSPLGPRIPRLMPLRASFRHRTSPDARRSKRTAGAAAFSRAQPDLATSMPHVENPRVPRTSGFWGHGRSAVANDGGAPDNGPGDDAMRRIEPALATQGADGCDDARAMGGDVGARNLPYSPRLRDRTRRPLHGFPMTPWRSTPGAASDPRRRRSERQACRARGCH